MTYLIIKMEDVEAEKRSLQMAKDVADKLEKMYNQNYMVVKEVKR